MRRGLRTTMTLLASLASACAGTSTGNPGVPPEEVPVPGSETHGGRCDETRTTLAGLDAASPLGFSAAEMLALAAQHEVPLEWQSRSGVSYGPESGQGTLTITVSAAGEPPRFVAREPRSSTGGPEPALDAPAIGSVCPDSLELDVRVHVQSSGGALDEHFDAKLTASTPRVARIYHSRKASDLGGRLEAQLASSPAAVLASVIFELEFSAYGAVGNLGLGFEEPRPANPDPNGTVGSAINPGPIARWPAGLACDMGGFGIPIDRSVDGLSVPAAIERLNAADLRLTAAGGEAVGVALRFAASGERACVVDVRDPDATPSLEVPGVLSIESEDGRIDGTWPVWLRAEAAPDATLGAVRVAFDLRGSIIAALVPAAEFETTYGVHGFDLAGYDEAGLVLMLAVGPGDAVSGELLVQGAKKPACPTAPVPSPSPGEGMSSPGCAGITLVPLWTAAFEPAD